MSQLVCTAS